ncbi:hypothetical protein U0038_06450 [Sphingobacterium spiritivorum]|uniref:Uncharacterized protein n=1 Tax=Sphingobacterium spiritivorum ATCC 33861 TaxID=525373 RepID=D7VJW7_SPHSI|nr:hypothetical protein [Sphingobacterium spiritivorum]EFK58569.1 hypothetical protein HMPREF0766_11286 [Sphingobacterium spiritivorum ATCC 33861]QQT34522.1 hypothetical protein I6J01_14515 [Sphingobacterium spiritivorum]WQD35384.1 hypothetical protein U0038_06450 [Sphingobacterium spiritivorum]SUJ00243.1 Uncharacterised protein [Sphingobacterium spiritivorum]
MKRFAGLLIALCLFPILVWSQSRNDAGLRGDAGATSGFFDANEPVNFPTGATNWWHLLDVRHSNPANNYAMQFSGSFGDQQLYFRKTDNNPATPWSRVLLETNGKVGIGTDNPQQKLDVKGHISADGSLISTVSDPDIGGTLTLGNPAKTANGVAMYWRIFNMAGVYGNSLQFWAYDAIGCTTGGLCTNRFTIMDNGNVGIGITTPRDKLAVNGNIRAREIKVETNNWPDYVFEEDYKLTPLAEVETFIKANKHLPEVPSAREIEEDGLSLGEMNKLMMKKIEELTLHLIEKDKQLQTQQEELNTLKTQFRTFQNK